MYLFKFSGTIAELKALKLDTRRWPSENRVLSEEVGHCANCIAIIPVYDIYETDDDGGEEYSHSVCSRCNRRI